MSKIELNISDKKLYNTTKEDIVLKSPSRIPPKGIQDLIALKGINSSEVAYYDIATTEQQGIKNTDNVVIYFFQIPSPGSAELNIKMGEYDGI